MAAPIRIDTAPASAADGRCSRPRPSAEAASRSRAHHPTPQQLPDEERWDGGDAGEPYDLPLLFLDPTGFPNLEAIREFVGGTGYEAMKYAIEQALLPGGNTLEEEAREFPKGFLIRAREAAIKLLDDLDFLTQAALDGSPVRATRSKEWLDYGRFHLLVVTLTPSWSDQRLLREFYRWLVDPEPPDSPALAEARARVERWRGEPAEARA